MYYEGGKRGKLPQTGAEPIFVIISDSNKLN